MRALLLMAVALGTGCLGVDEEAFELGTMPVLPSEESAEAPSDPARVALLERLRTRYPEIRRLKADWTVGETYDGWLAERPSPVWEDALYAERARALVAEENADRALLYEQELARYAAEIDAQLQQQLPAMRQQVVDQLCAALPAGVGCDEIAESVIDAALQPALQAAREAVLVEVRAVVQRIHAQFWQDRATAPGEWIEVEGDAGALEWRAKAEGPVS